MSDPIPLPRAPSSHFPSDVLKWMKQNAAPKMAVKLMKCHNYFQHKEFPYFVVKEIEYIHENNKWYLFTLDKKELEYEGAEGIEKITKKLWITEDLSLQNYPKPISSLIPLIAVCDIEGLKLANQKITCHEFKFLSSSGTLRTLQLRMNTTIMDDNGVLLFFEDILQCVPSVKHFYYDNLVTDIFSLDFVNTFRDINASKLEVIGLTHMNFSTFEIFLNFMEHNPHIKYELYFYPDSLSDEETKALEDYAQRIVDAGITEYPPPEIEILGQHHRQFHHLSLLFIRYKENKKIWAL